MTYDVGGCRNERVEFSAEQANHKKLMLSARFPVCTVNLHILPMPRSSKHSKASETPGYLLKTNKTYGMIEKELNHFTDKNKQPRRSGRSQNNTTNRLPNIFFSFVK